MNIINLNRRKSLAGLGAAALILGAFVYGGIARADHTDIHVSGAANGSVIMDGNATSSVLASFSPDLDLASSTSASLTANATSSVTAYYGVDIESGTTTGDVHWRITVSHATEALALGDVIITEKGYFDAGGGVVANSGYVASAVSGDLVFTGNGGWEVFDGDEFSNVDEIIFDDDAPPGVYTITRELMETLSNLPIDNSFSFITNLMASVTSTTTATSSPIITILGDNPMGIFACNGFIDPGVTAVDSSGASISATSTTSIDLNVFGNQVIIYSATDAEGHTATTTRTVLVRKCSSGGSSPRPATPPGLLNAVQNASPNSNVSAVLAGQVEGRSGEVLGLAIGHFFRTLRQGDRGDDVALLQTRLASAGLFRASATGFFGPITANAVRALQRGLGVPVTGMLDVNTMMVLNES